MQAIRRLTIIAFHAPPRGGIASIRAAKLAKYLTRLGWEITILTSKPDQGEPLDPSLMSELPVNVQIVQLPFWNVQQRVRKLFGKLPGVYQCLQACWIPDDKVPWGLYAIIWLLLHPQKTDAIVSTSPTAVSHFLAALLHAQNPKAPWLIDLRDEWSLNPYANNNPWHHFWNVRLERWLFGWASHIGVVNQALHDKYARHLNKALSQKLTILHNGFDHEQIADILSNQAAEEQPIKSRLTFAYAGSFYGDRTPVIFFEALQHLFEQNVIPATAIAIQFCGNTKQYKLEYPGLEFVQSGFLPYEKTLSVLAQADVLLHISSVPDAHGGKTFDYIGLGKPILALIHSPSDLETLLKSTNLATIAQFNSVQAVESAITEIYLAWQTGQLNPTPNQTYIDQYTRLALAEKIDQLLTGSAAI
jgi:glycosyltransferase involved in cell wall biosynthesis